MITPINKFLLIALIVHPFQIFSMKEATTKGVSVGVAIVGSASLAVITGVSVYFLEKKHNKDLLEKAKFDLEKAKFDKAHEEKKKKEAVEEAEQKKKEAAEQAEKDRKKQEEIQKLQAKDELRNIKDRYAGEVKCLREGNLPGNLPNIIRENYGMEDMPLNYYYAKLVRDFEALKQIENDLSSVYQQERQITLDNLGHIYKIYNKHVAPEAKEETEAAENKQIDREARQRKIENELLEADIKRSTAEAMRLKANTYKEKQQTNMIIREKLDAASIERKEMSDSINALRNAESKHTHELNQAITKNQEKEDERASKNMSTLQSLSDIVVQNAQELKQAINKNEENAESYFNRLFSLIDHKIDQVRQHVNSWTQQQQQQPVVQPQPSYNSEYVQQSSGPGSSAPMGS